MTQTESLIFLGSKKAGLEMCTLLAERADKSVFKAIVCPNDTSDSRSVLQDFQNLGTQFNIPVLISSNSQDTLRILGELDATTVIVHGWYQIIPVALFPATLFLGFHYSPLPKYRGNAPLVWQIIRGEKQLGVSFFELTTGMDEGRLVAQDFFTLHENESVADALLKANRLALEMMTDFLEYWPQKSPNLAEQPNLDASYCGMRTPEDGHINWTWPAAVVHNFIRAQAPPYPGAFSLLPDSSKIVVTKSSVEQETWYGVPGSVLRIVGDEVTIACGEGAIRIHEISLEDQIKSFPAQILRSMKIRLL